jgi:hypothetical protein
MNRKTKEESHAMKTIGLLWTYPWLSSLLHLNTLVSDLLKKKKKMESFWKQKIKMFVLSRQ